MSEEQKNSWGGVRPGAGRPQKPHKLFSFRIPKELGDVIESQPNKSKFIKDAINGYLAVQGSSGLSGFSQNSNAGGAKGLESLGQVIPATKVRPMTLPYFDQRVVAGFPIPLDNDEISQDIEVLKMLCPHPESSYLIRVSGTSMIDANIHDGDIVIVDKSNRNPTERDIAVCELNGEYTLKRFVMRNGEGWLVPANPQFPEIRVTPDDDFSVWGIVTYIIHKA